jgi:hypothetical protein
MHKTRLPLRTWFWAAYLVSTFHPGISAKQLQRQLGIRRHETAWAMLHKLHAAMVAPERELLKDEVEIDEFFLGGYEEGLKGGRQRGRKVLCGVAIEVRGRGSGRLRLAVLKDASGPSLLAFTKATTQPEAIVHSDGLQSYRTLANHGYDHRRLTQTAAAPGEQMLPRAHRAISNLKAWMHGTHRGAHPSTCPSTSTSSSSATTAAAPPWPASRRSSGSGSHTTRSATETSSSRRPDGPLGANRVRTSVLVLKVTPGGPRSLPELPPGEPPRLRLDHARGCLRVHARPVPRLGGAHHLPRELRARALAHRRRGSRPRGHPDSDTRHRRGS